MFGHGTDLPEDSEPADYERDFGTEPPVPDNRIPVAPFDVRQNQRGTT